MTADATHEGLKARLPPLLLAVFATLGALPVLRSLIVPDLNWCYPYVTADSYDWISNGLHWAGENVECSWRPPGLPLLIAGLFRLGLLSWLPVVNFVVVGLTTAVLYAFLRERHSASISALACWFFFANDYVQDLAKYVMAEVYCTFFIVLAAHAFFRASRQPRYYRRCGLVLGVGFLFHHATIVAGIGFAAAFVLTRRADIRRSEAWQGLAGGGVLAGGWAVTRWAQYHAHPYAPHHIQEELLRFSPGNVSFYAVAGTALLGLVVLPLYGAGFLRLLAKDFPDRAYRATVVAPLLALTVFWFFFYDWADKRFLYYLFPLCICVLAEGLDLLAAWARCGRLAALGALALLVPCLLWNQIRYPSYGIFYLALTPKLFLEAAHTTRSDLRSEVHLTGARVVRLHETLASSFSRGLFDPRPRSAPCSLADPAFACLGTLKSAADRLLAEGQPIGFRPPRSWPSDRLVSFIRLRNIFLRPIVDPPAADISLAGVEAAPGADFSRPPFDARCGPYVLVRTR